MLHGADAPCRAVSEHSSPGMRGVLMDTIFRRIIFPLNQIQIENVRFDDSLIGITDMSRSSAYELVS